MFYLWLIAAIALLPVLSAQADDARLSVKILAINDFHGHLQPPASGILVQDPARPGGKKSVPAGGAEHMATLLKRLKAQNPHHAFVAAGDLVGASPMLSALFHDEPTIEALDMMGLDASAVGNHEFDEGWPELWRKQHGGCHPVDGCRGPRQFQGAKFQYLSASTRRKDSGKTFFPAYAVKVFDGIPVAFIGLTLRATPTMVRPKGVQDLLFDDEADSVNRLIPRLKAQNIEAIVVLIHEGGLPVGDYNECPGISGPIVQIVERLDPAVDLVISGHTHRAYNCRIDGRLVTSGDRYGTIVSDIDLVLDRNNGDVVESRANNWLVSSEDLPKDPQMSALIAEYETLVAPLIHQPVGRIEQDFRDDSPSGATSTGQMVADAQLAATLSAGAQFALVNRGSLRAPLLRQGDGTVTMGQVFAIQPFRNPLVTVTLSGAQIVQALERQWSEPDKFRPLQVSQGFSYVWDPRRPVGQRILADSVRVQGQVLRSEAFYRVTVNQFLYDGGDGFRVFAQGRDPVTGMLDNEAVNEYFRSRGTVHPPALDRVIRAGDAPPSVKHPVRALP